MCLQVLLQRLDALRQQCHCRSKESRDDRNMHRGCSKTQPAIQKNIAEAQYAASSRTNHTSTARIVHVRSELANVLVSTELAHLRLACCPCTQCSFDSFAPCLHLVRQRKESEPMIGHGWQLLVPGLQVFFPLGKVSHRILLFSGLLLCLMLAQRELYGAHRPHGGPRSCGQQGRPGGAKKSSQHRYTRQKRDGSRICWHANNRGRRVVARRSLISGMASWRLVVLFMLICAF